MTLEHREAGPPHEGPATIPQTAAPRERLDSVDSTGEPRYAVSVARRKDSRNWRLEKLPFSYIRDKAEHPADRKECGNYLLGTLRDGRRTKDAVVSRSGVALDADKADAVLGDDVKALGVLALVHTTFSSSPDELRLRVVLPLDREVSPAEYVFIVEALVDHLGREKFDASTSQAERYMFWPAVNPERPDSYRFEEFDGPALVADEWLDGFEEEQAELEGDILPPRVDAREAPGVVGAVARAYSIAEVIPAFDLPYDPAGADRWKYRPTRGNAGLSLGNGYGYAISGHTSDPAHNGGHRVSAFDLVRLHRFGDLDDAASQRAAEELFEADPRVAEELATSPAGNTGSKRGPGRPSAAEAMVKLAGARYRLLLGPDRDLYASPLNDDGSSSPYVLWEEDGSLAEDLRLTYDLDTGKVASTSAAGDAVAHLRALTRRRGTPERIFRRVARIGDESWINLGDGRRVARVEPGRWSVVDEVPSGTNFRRSATMAEQVLPAPPGTGDVDRLWLHINAPEEDRPLVLAWAVHALVDSDSPHAALLLTGGQGSGKSTATSRLTDLVDPTSAHPTRKTSDERAWVIRAMSSWVLVVDNLSSMSADFSDLLATTATGAGVSYRKLYTNGELVTATLLNPMILNGITVDGMRPDLLDRTVAIRLDRIPSRSRKDAAAQTALWRRDRPLVLGGLLDLAAAVMERDVLGLIDVPEDGLPRMTGYARVLLALDEILGTDGFRTFQGHGRTAAAETVEADVILASLVRLVTRRTVASAGELVELLDRDDELVGRLAEERRSLNARTVAASIRRGGASLEALGWTVHDAAPRGKAGVTLWTIEPPEDDEEAAR